jgi:hypothetical protein
VKTELEVLHPSTETVRVMGMKPRASALRQAILKTHEQVRAPSSGALQSVLPWARRRWPPHGSLAATNCFCDHGPGHAAHTTRVRARRGSDVRGAHSAAWLGPTRHSGRRPVRPGGAGGMSQRSPASRGRRWRCRQAIRCCERRRARGLVGRGSGNRGVSGRTWWISECAGRKGRGYPDGGRHGSGRSRRWRPEHRRPGRWRWRDRGDRRRRGSRWNLWHDLRLRFDLQSWEEQLQHGRPCLRTGCGAVRDHLRDGQGVRRQRGLCRLRGRRYVRDRLQARHLRLQLGGPDL